MSEHSEFRSEIVETHEDYFGDPITVTPKGGSPVTGQAVIYPGEIRRREDNRLSNGNRGTRLIVVKTVRFKLVDGLWMGIQILANAKITIQGQPHDIEMIVDQSADSITLNLMQYQAIEMTGRNVRTR